MHYQPTSGYLAVPPQKTLILGKWLRTRLLFALDEHDYCTSYLREPYFDFCTIPWPVIGIPENKGRP